MRKKTKKHDDATIALFTEAGKTNFPVPDACMLSGITLEEFAESEDLQTALSIRSKLVDEAINGDIKSIRLFLDHFAAQILPRIEDMPDE